MELKKLFLEQLEAEGEASRKTIERVPEGQGQWKPHPKSMELGKLAALAATMPGWIAAMINMDELDLNGDGQRFRTVPLESRKELIAALEKNMAEARAALEGTTEEHLMLPWKLKMDELVLIDSPRYICIAESALSHLAHHRGQLTVYLRLLEASVPAIYGPSADEA